MTAKYVQRGEEIDSWLCQNELEICDQDGVSTTSPTIYNRSFIRSYWLQEKHTVCAVIANNAEFSKVRKCISNLIDKLKGIENEDYDYSREISDLRDLDSHLIERYDKNVS